MKKLKLSDALHQTTKMLLSLFFVSLLAVGSVWAESVTYTVESKNSVSTSGSAPTGSSATYSSTYSTTYQLTSGNSMTLTLTGFSGKTITGISMSMKSNNSGGAGSFSMKAGSTTLSSISASAFNTNNWHGAWSNAYVSITPTMSVSNHAIQEGENVVITIAATANSLYCQSFTITYVNSTPFTVTFPLTNTSVTETSVGSGVTIQPLESNNSEYTFYGWTTSNIETETTTEPSIVNINENFIYHPERDIDLYPVFTRTENGSTGWQNTTDLSTITEGIYILTTPDGHAFNGEITSGHGQSTSNTFQYNENGIATSKPNGAIELTFTGSNNGYTMYAEGYGYLYASAASSGNLAWHNTENSYWSFSTSNWRYSSNNAYLRTYNSTFRTYGNNSNGVLSMAKKISTGIPYYISTPEQEQDQVATPAFSPEAGEYASAQEIAISCETEGASISYALVQGNPTDAPEQLSAYTSPIALSTNGTYTIFAQAYKDGMTNSEMARATYIINVSNYTLTSEVSPENSGTVVFVTNPFSQNPTPVTSAEEGSFITVIATPAEGYLLDELVITNTSNQEPIQYNTSNYPNAREFVMPAANVHVTATFAKSYTVSAGTTEDGINIFNIYPTPAIAGATIDIYVTTNEGYQLSSTNPISIEFDDDEYTGALPVITRDAYNENLFTFTMPAANVTVTPNVSSVSTNYIVMVDAAPENAGSAIIVDAEDGDIIEVEKDTEVTVSATPATGYQFVNWTNNGQTVSTDNPYTFTVTEDIELIANFSEAIPTEPNTVTFNTGNGEPMTVTEETPGAGITLPSITPCETAVIDGYTFAGWTTTDIETETATAPTTLYAANTPYQITENNITLYAVYTINTPTGSIYRKVTTTPNSWDGQYLIVCESQNVAFNGSLDSLDLASNNISVTININNGVIENTFNNDPSFTIATAENGYSIQSASGRFIGRNAYSNGLDEKKTFTNFSNNIITLSGSNVLIQGNATSEGRTTLKYNSTANQHRFRYYKSGQTDIQLYKYEEILSAFYTSHPDCTPIVATPTLSEPAGTYDNSLNVLVDCETEDAILYYTLDGTEPTTESEIYQDGILIDQPTTLTVMAVKEGYRNSSVVSATYDVPYTLYKIREFNALTNVDADTRYRIASRPVVTGIHLNQNNEVSSIFVQDSTGGLRVFPNHLTIPTYQVGDIIPSITGTYMTYYNLPEMKLTVVPEESAGQGTPTAVELTLDQLTSVVPNSTEAIKYGNNLVVIRDIHFNTANNYTTGELGTTTAFRESANGADLYNGFYTLNTNLKKDNRADIYGIAGTHSGHGQIMPRSNDDIIIETFYQDTVDVTACDSYLWPINQREYTFSGLRSATVELPDVDSVYTINLTINNSNTGDTTAVACGSFTWHEITYTEVPETDPTYTLTNVFGCDSVVTLHLTIHPIPVLTITNNPDQDYVCEGQSIELTVVHTNLEEGTTDQYLWSNDEMTQSITVTPAQTTDYEVVLEDHNGCMGYASTTINVHPQPVAVISAPALDTICPSDTKTFTAENADEQLFTYQWYKDNVAIDGATSSSYTLTNPTGDLSGDYTVFVSNMQGTCTDLSEAAHLLVNGPGAPGYEFTLTPNAADIYDTIRIGYCDVTHNFVEPVYTHYLDGTRFAEVTITNDAQNPYGEPGDYLITWTATDACGNTATCTQTLHIALEACPNAVDAENNEYPSVRINCECWTTTNLRSTRYSDGSLVEPFMSYYSQEFPNTSNNVNNFGYLYNWSSTVAEGNAALNTPNERGHIQGICPDGWYLPTNNQYEDLVGELSTWTMDNHRSEDFWLDGGGNNASGMNLLPGGRYSSDTQRFENMSGNCYFWSAYEYDNTTATTIEADCHCYVFKIYSNYKDMGYSVRCIKERTR